MTIDEEGEIVARSIDLKRIKDIPILFSVLQESLRHRSSGAGARPILRHNGDYGASGYACNEV